MTAHLLFLCLLTLPVVACGAEPIPPHITRYPSGQWFVPANSALGPPLSQVKKFVMVDGTVSNFPEGCPPFFWVKAFVLYDGTVCLNVKGKDDQKP